jgi:hypothetical protein
MARPLIRDELVCDRGTGCVIVGMTLTNSMARLHQLVSLLLAVATRAR